MKVILNETIESLGIIGSEVTVSDGFGRNYLLPQKKAVAATPQNRNIFLQQKARLDLQIAKEREFAGEMAKKLESVICKITAKVSDEDRLYGSISIREIMDALSDQGVEVDKKMILLAEPIKQTGTFKIPIRVYQGIEPEITVEVIPEQSNE
ncbi:MAG: 50S ribosomal protein L9 [Desulfobacterales bacterium]|nr:50S ribosomal protein L9 [Desulfobacterales bacterium]MDD4071221.1 50S ribosomal protein L9 [Desulfobacterales bacterium]MDD4392229.1 50S ribosomal protein L9 [Desulfobacterales bacterium]